MSEHERSLGGRGCAGDAAAYALGALEPAEAEAFRRHLESCVVCRDELAAFERVVDVLPSSAPQYRAPSALRRRVIGEVRADARRRARTGAPDARRSAWAGAAGVRRLPRLQLGLAGTGALAALIVALVLVLGGGGHGASSSRVVAAQVSGPGSAEVRLSGARAELIVHGLPAAPPGEVYEVWLQTGSAPPRPANTLFDVGARGGASVGIVDRVSGATRLMVTAERAGGSAVPTHAPVIVARLD
ncbi:MAG TPA: anti-sigma factor [Solirubrobacteraceae bacterium]|nr:anti-sigma factor [Solirubrobacteraceae bacterium]